ncbi:Hint domain-containing protein [Bradyrhizobium jicamae]|uniref:Hint domain-containing protein n=1 Tax=Bradyrhizobium jicamae TaxID=280332 RepID=UPI001BAA9541|nr:Hint domain-containing protein [Bradyrhizobium jicamae]MBR0750737.1 Hint domain-containing protein [Bradyrhizobium jicamae]
MANTTETFNYAYSLSLDTNGNYTLVDANPASSGVNPVANGVELKDSDGGTLSSGDKLKVSSIDSGNLGSTGKYEFVGTADVGSGQNKISGLIIEDKNGNYFFLTDKSYGGNTNGTNGQLNHVDTTSTTSLCFLPGTMIRTPDGEVAVQTLKPGHQVLTHDGRVAVVDWLGIQTISLVFADKLRVLPICVKAGAIAENVPSRDLFVSPDHALLVGGVLIQAGALVNGTSIVRHTDMPSTFTYYHVEVEDHSLVLADNMPAETFVDNVDRLHFDNWAEHQALYPEGKNVSELPYPRAKSHRQVPVSIRVMLAERAHAIGAAVASASVA